MVLCMVKIAHHFQRTLVSAWPTRVRGTMAGCEGRGHRAEEITSFSSPATNCHIPGFMFVLKQNKKKHVAFEQTKPYQMVGRCFSSLFTNEKHFICFHHIMPMTRNRWHIFCPSHIQPRRQCLMPMWGCDRIESPYPSAQIDNFNFVRYDLLYYKFD